MAVPLPLTSTMTKIDEQVALRAVGADSLLARLDGPAGLKSLDARQLDAVAEQIRTAIIATTAVTGGHLGPSLGVVELTIALHPGATLIRSRHPVYLIWIAHQHPGATNLLADISPDARGEDVLVSRIDDGQVAVARLQQGEAAFLSALADGATLGASWSQALAAHPQFDLAVALGDLAGQHALVGRHVRLRHVIGRDDIEDALEAIGDAQALQKTRAISLRRLRLHRDGRGFACSSQHRVHRSQQRTGEAVDRGPEHHVAP